MTREDRFELFSAIFARDLMAWCAGAYALAGLILAAIVSVEIALFISLPVAALLTWRAVQAQRRIDSIFARSLAAHLAEHGTEHLAEAA